MSWTHAMLVVCIIGAATCAVAVLWGTTQPEVLPPPDKASLRNRTEAPGVIE
jgi:hypothetical protein